MRTQLLSHNKTAYKKVMNAFETSNRTCVVHPTGTGKSYLIAAVSESFKNVLILGPNEFVLTQVRNVLEWRKQGVEYMTYAWLNLHGADGDYDLICLDEFHRAGAAEWGDAVSDLLAVHPDTKILGTTATPVRHLDGERNMADELFEGNVASEITLGEAMSRNILPIPTYVTGLFDFSSTARSVEEKISASKYISKEEKRQRLEKLKVSDEEWERSSGMPIVLRKHISPYSRRIIVFCSDVPTLKQMSHTVREWFVKAGIKVSAVYTIHNEMGSSRQKAVMKKFEKDDADGCKIMMSVNMLNEGVHIPRVGSVLMLRTTQSRIVYMQQMGRCLTASNTERPVILDMVNNISNTSVIHELKRDFDGAEIKRSESEGDGYVPRQLYVTDYTHTVRDVITALQQGTTNNRMTLEEIRQHITDFTAERDRWPSHGVNSSKYESSLAHRFWRLKDRLLEDGQFRRLYEYYSERNKPFFDKCYAKVLEYCEKYDRTPIVSSRRDTSAEVGDELREAFNAWIWLKKNHGDDARVKAIHGRYSVRTLRDDEIKRRVEVLTSFINEHHRQPSTYYGGTEIKLSNYINQFRATKRYHEREDVKGLFALLDSVKPQLEDVRSLAEEYARFCEEHGHIPSRFSKDGYELDLYKRTEKRKALRKVGLYMETRERYKHKRLDDEEEVRIVTDHCEATGRLPSKKSSTPIVFRAWQNIKRTHPEVADALRKRYHATRILTDTQIRDVCDELIGFLRKNGRRPSYRRGEKRECNMMNTVLYGVHADNPDVIRLRNELEGIPYAPCSVGYYSRRQVNLRYEGGKNGYTYVKDKGKDPSTRYVIFFSDATERDTNFEEACREAGLEIREGDG